MAESPVPFVKGIEVTASDGGASVFTLMTESGAVRVAAGPEVLVALLAGVAHAIDPCPAGFEDRSRRVIRLSRWFVGSTTEGAVTITLGFGPDGVSLTFAMERAAAEAMLETLGVVLGRASPGVAGPGRPPN